MASSGRQKVPITGVELDSDDDASTSEAGSWGSNHHVLTTATKRVDIGATVTSPGSAAERTQASVFNKEAPLRPASRRPSPSPDQVFGNLDYKRTQDGMSVVQPLYVEAVPFPYSGSTNSRGSESKPTSTSSSASRSARSGKKTPSETVSRKQRSIEESQKAKQVSYRMTLTEKIVLVSFIVLLVAVIGTTCGITGCRAGKNTGTLQTVRSRGRLRCGVTDFELTEGRESAGLSKIMCDVVAAGIFGSSDGHIEYIPVTPINKFTNLQSNEVDVLTSGTTHTMERQVFEPTTQMGFCFSTPYFYGGLTFGGLPEQASCADELVSTITASRNCSQLVACVIDGTVSQLKVARLLPGARLVIAPDSAAFYRNLRDGICNVLAGNLMDTSEQTVRDSGFFGEYAQGVNVYSNEPFSMVTRADDPQWSDFVSWVVQALLSAERQRIGQTQASLMIRTSLFGDDFQDVFRNVISEFGNYGELYEKAVESTVPRTNVNALNSISAGLIHSIPFGNLQVQGSAPIAGSTLDTIQSRGHLNCGIVFLEVFATKNPVTNEYEGFDVDFCKAVAAAIFKGDSSRINYVETVASERFRDLEEGRVDVLSRYTTHNFERDVKEPTTGTGYAFSQINFYDGLSFGGIPPYDECAANHDIVSSMCSEIAICVNNGTTTLERTRQIFLERAIRPQANSTLVARGLETGECNVIAGGLIETARSNVRNIGLYDGPYEIVGSIFSDDPLALTTTQEDHQWSAFVFWVVSALFYAEEQGISQRTSSQMPTVGLFGPEYLSMFQDAVGAVGSYHDIYDRHVEQMVPRRGLNRLSTLPLEYQHYPVPGLEI